MENWFLNIQQIKMKERISKSIILTFTILLLSILINYIIVFFIFLIVTPCYQKNSPVLDLSILFNCTDIIINLTSIFLVFWILILFLFKKKSILNSKGMRYFNIFLILLFILFYLSIN